MKVLKLYQPNCNPCVSVTNFLDDQEVNYESIDVTQNTDIAMKYGVMSTPITILLDDEGKEVKRVRGFNPAELEEIVELLN
jgi:thioredoxin 1